MGAIYAAGELCVTAYLSKLSGVVSPGHQGWKSRLTEVRREPAPAALASEPGARLNSSLARFSGLVLFGTIGMSGLAKTELGSSISSAKNVFKPSTRD